MHQEFYFFVANLVSEFYCISKLYEANLTAFRLSHQIISVFMPFLPQISLFHISRTLRRSDKRMICNFLRNLTATNCRQFFLLLSKLTRQECNLTWNKFVRMSAKVLLFSFVASAREMFHRNIIIYILFLHL